MPWLHDRRNWIDTDLPGERLTISHPCSGIEVLSVSGSKRRWRESHDGFTLGVIHHQEALGVEWRTRARSLSSSAGDIMAIEPGDIHVTERLSLPERGADFDIVRFSPTFVSDAARELGLRGGFHFNTPAVQDPLTFNALRQLVDAVANGGDAGDLESACAIATHTVISRLAEAPTRLIVGANPIRDFRLRRLVDYLQAHLHKRPSLDELAAAAQLSKWRLCVIFEQAYGISIGNYWRELRSRDAGRRLRRGVPIKVIVSELGYADEPHFSREFKAHYGLTPARWLALSGVSARLAR